MNRTAPTHTPITPDRLLPASLTLLQAARVLRVPLHDLLVAIVRCDIPVRRRGTHVAVPTRDLLLAFGCPEHLLEGRVVGGGA